MIIGLVGFIGSGKDTAADFLVNQHGWRRDSFAAPLKDAVATVFGWDRDLLEGRTTESRAWRECVDSWWSDRLGMEITPRRVLQLWGTEVVRRGYHNDMWVASLEHRLLKTTDNVVITDCRFPNEITAIQRSGGRVFRIQRGPDPAWMPSAMEYLENRGEICQPPSLLPHASEWSWLASRLDATITNDGSIGDLYTSLEAVIDSYWPDAYNVILRNKENP